MPNEQNTNIYRIKQKTGDNTFQYLPIDAQTVQGIDVTNTANLVNGAGFITTPIPSAPSTAGIWKLVCKTVGSDMTYQWVQDPGLPCEITYDSTNQQIEISNVYGIYASIANGSLVGPYTINAGGSATLTLTADQGYSLPVEIAVAGVATHTYSQSTGVVVLTNPTANVTVAAVCTAQ